ncbi:transport protein (probable substrate cationic amino acids) [Natronomonas pharaonis DSM 2160]|uniref:Transport protein (Probable substrate cationic amino acids) n=1 Tax=Natronomonas pharaonis (strain ATCC 35678 / DSM 2160 / CIP 103997 / JCM 8858 / NBRC 14720 / NCIMB 2260 / Gabara) TaxID=348780 RepID=A0A1U7ETZ7_NATPD|nr:APC family permease [Natronomonas pharaonis]CAI48414.1 transport protein (probable substrate cationic amino acids) [Natronomonas pharaonis DSM 2160]
MPTDLKRDLGLPETTAIAIGAMVGSGIFILPGIAYLEAGGPSVVAAFLVAAVLIVPAALSASEMATAMPEDGGSYVYVERGMGPLLGTIAGLGNWFMLSFKGALALVGGVPYLVYVAPAIADATVPIVGDPVIALALAIATGFIVLNLVSTSSTGRLQFFIVGVMVVVMGAFVLLGGRHVDPAQTDGLTAVGEGNFLAATALVFISYAGVIKIAAVAEEVKDPGRVIPQAMLGSLLVTTLLYVLVVYVAIGIVDVDAAIGQGLLAADGEGAIMAIAADQAIGTVGVIAVTVAALLALASTANAGLLSASRFPFAMARDDLAPSAFATVSERFGTPVLAVATTGAVMLVMIAYLPIDQVAKLGSAFQILVFILVNLALVGFREGALEEYNPEFVSPLYPWMQLFGMASGFVVLTQIGLFPFAAAVAVTGVSVVYYYAYARHRVDREGAARTGVRKEVGDRAIERTEELFADDRTYDALVAITDETSEPGARDMLRVAADLSRLGSTHVSAVRFSETPQHVFGGHAPDVAQADDPDWLPFDERPEWLAAATRAGGGPEQSSITAGSLPQTDTATEATLEAAAGTAVDYREVTAENVRQAVVDFATFEGYDLLLLERRREDFHRRLFGVGDTEWFLRNAPCGVLLVEDRGFDGADEIAVVASRGAYDPLKLLVADAIAEETGARITLLQAVPEAAPEQRREAIEDYHAALISILTVPAQSRVIEADDRVAGLARFAEPADLLVTGTEARGFGGELLGRPDDRLVDSVDCTAVMVQPESERRVGFLKRAVLDRLF